MEQPHRSPSLRRDCELLWVLAIKAGTALEEEGQILGRGRCGSNREEGEKGTNFFSREKEHPSPASLLPPSV